MPRSLDANQLTEIAKQQTSIGWLVELQFGAGTLFYTTRPHSVSWNGHTYTALANLLELDTFSEDLVMGVGIGTMNLSGVNTANLAAMLGGDYLNRKVIVYLGLFNASNALIGNPIVLHDGLMDGFDFDETPQEGTAELRAASSNHWADFDRSTGRSTNSASQQVHFAGDVGFDYAWAGDRDLVWGG